MGDGFLKLLDAPHAHDSSSRINITRKMQNIQDKQAISEAAGKRALVSYWGMQPRTLGSEMSWPGAQDSHPDLLAGSGTCQAALSLRAFAFLPHPDVCTDGPLWVSI